MDSLRAAPDVEGRVARMREEREGDLLSPALRAFDHLRKHVVEAIPDEAEAMDMLEGIERAVAQPGKLLDAVYQEVMASVGEGVAAFDDIRKNYEQNGLSRDVAEQLVGQGLPILLSVLGPKKV